MAIFASEPLLILDTMNKRTFTPDEKTAIVQEANEIGVRTTCDKHGISTSVLYDWRRKENASATLTSATPQSATLKSKPSATPKRTIGDIILDKGIECLGCGEILEAMFKPCKCGNDSHLSPNLTSKGTLIPPPPKKQEHFERADLLCPLCNEQPLPLGRVACEDCVKED